MIAAVIRASQHTFQNKTENKLIFVNFGWIVCRRAAHRRRILHVNGNSTPC